MTALPNQTRRPIPLDALLARHAPARPSTGPFHRSAIRQPPPTLADLERRASVAPDSTERSDAPTLTAPADLPRALVLCVTHATCSCGRTYVYPNRAILVRFDKAGLSNAVHYARGTLDQYAALPRERKTLAIEIPYCDECF